MTDEKRVRAKRLRAMVDTHWGFLGRLVRNSGVPKADLDDARQQVYVVAAAELDDIRAGSERSYLAQTAVHVAARARGARARAREVFDGGEHDVPDLGHGPDDAVGRAPARRALDAILAGLGEDLRAVFVLYELEEMTMAEIASALAGSPGRPRRVDRERRPPGRRGRRRARRARGDGLA
jgi:RNA polymerase sigma-70 factor (ECF subfamily)